MSDKCNCNHESGFKTCCKMFLLLFVSCIFTMLMIDLGYFAINVGIKFMNIIGL